MIHNLTLFIGLERDVRHLNHALPITARALAMVEDAVGAGQLETIPDTVEPQ